MLILPEMFTYRHNQLHDRGRNHSKIHTKHICIYRTPLHSFKSTPTVHDTLTIPIQSALHLRADASVQASLQTQTSSRAQRPDTDFIRPAERVLPARLLTRSGLLAANGRLLHSDNCSFLFRRLRSARHSPALLQRFSSTLVDLRSREKVTLCDPPSVISTLVHIYRADRLPSKGLFFCDGPTRRVWNSRKSRQAADTALSVVG